MNRKTIGVLLIILPSVLFIANIVLWPFVMRLAGNGVSTARAINLVSGFAGLVLFVAVPICFIAGVVVLATGKKE